MFIKYWGDIMASFSKWCADKIAETRGLSDEDHQKLAYGLSIIYINFTKTVILFICAWVLGILKETVVMMCSYAFVRSVAFGEHSDNTIKCTVVCLVLFLGVTKIAILLNPFSTVVCTVVLVVTEAIFIKYAPVATEKRPISDEKKAKFKMYAVIISLELVIGAVFVGENMYRNLIVMGVALEALFVLPFMKKIIK